MLDEELNDHDALGIAVCAHDWLARRTNERTRWGDLDDDTKEAWIDTVRDVWAEGPDFKPPKGSDGYTERYAIAVAALSYRMKDTVTL